MSGVSFSSSEVQQIMSQFEQAAETLRKKRESLLEMQARFGVNDKTIIDPRWGYSHDAGKGPNDVSKKTVDKINEELDIVAKRMDGVKQAVQSFLNANMSNEDAATSAMNNVEAP